jgi:hypothetical protein
MVLIAKSEQLTISRFESQVLKAQIGIECPSPVRKPAPLSHVEETVEVSGELINKRLHNLVGYEQAVGLQKRVLKLDEAVRQLAPRPFSVGPQADPFFIVQVD